MASSPHTPPLLLSEPLYIGVDIGKQKHVAGFISSTLLQRFLRFEACPALAFDNSREGFRSLIERTRTYAPLEHCAVLMEITGHYHRTLEQYLQELDVPVYVIHVQKRQAGLLKTDKRDALTLANHLYNQLDRGIQVADKLHLVRRAVPPTEAAAQLKGLMRHRYELVRECTQRKNKLTALCDEIFPEFTHIFHDPNLPTALAFRERFPTPQILATAPLQALQEVRAGKHSLSHAKLLELQRLAAQSIGTKDPVRQRGLMLEQTQLITELALLRTHIDQLETTIVQIVEQAREGQILQSIPGVGPLMAATIIAAIGAIDNFPSAATLKAYFGWAPQIAQSGTTLNRAKLARGGTRTMKQMMFLIVAQVIRMKTNEYAALYERLVHAKCPYDERTGRYKRKLPIMGRVAGQMTELIYALLKRDAEMVAAARPGQELPKPVLYDAELHHRHRHGEYTPSKPTKRPTPITLQPPR